MKLRGKVAIVTGGSRGIGRAVAEAFSREGAKVAIFARDRKEISNAVSGIKRISGAAPLGAVCDVSSDAAVRRAVGRVAAKFRRIDILVNAAGIQAPIGSFPANGMDEWEKNVEVNLLGTVRACHAVIPFMMKRRSGSIINFSGGGATSSRPNFSAYASAKAGAVKFTEVLADEMKPYGIKVNAIAPGAVNTAMLKEVLRVGGRAGKKEIADAKKRAKEGGVPPELAASLAVFLASGDSGGLSGRLVSSTLDNWKKWDKKMVGKIMKGDALKMRRVKI